MAQLDVENFNLNNLSASRNPDGGVVYTVGAFNSTSGVLDSSGSMTTSNFHTASSNGLTVLNDGRIVIGDLTTMSGPISATKFRVYSSDGSYLSTNTVEREHSTKYVSIQLAATNDGGLIVASNKASDYDRSGIYFEKFDSGLNRVWGHEVVPETLDRSVIESISVSENDDIAFVYRDDSNELLWGLVNSLGEAVVIGGSIQSPTSGLTGNLSDVTWISPTEFLVVGTDIQGTALYAQKVDNEGSLSGELIKISDGDPTTGNLSGSVTPPSVTPYLNGGAVFAWQVINQDSSTEVFFKAMLPDNSLGTQYAVQPTSGNQLYPVAIANSTTNISLLWSSENGSTLNHIVIASEASQQNPSIIGAGDNIENVIVPVTARTSGEILTGISGTIYFQYAYSGNQPVIYKAVYVQQDSPDYTDWTSWDQGLDITNHVSLTGTQSSNKITVAPSAGLSIEEIVIDVNGYIYPWQGVSVSIKDNPSIIGAADNISGVEIPVTATTGGKIATGVSGTLYFQYAYRGVQPEIYKATYVQQVLPDYKNWDPWYEGLDITQHVSLTGTQNSNVITVDSSAGLSEEDIFINVNGYIFPWMGVSVGIKEYVVESLYDGDFVLLYGGEGGAIGIQPYSEFLLNNPICFLKGTEIETNHGPVRVEELSVGTSVLIHCGTFKAIKRIGKQVIHRRFAQITDALPVRIPKGFCFEGYPSEDILLSPHHAVLIAGHLIEARAFLTINRVAYCEDVPNTLEYYHIELDSHELIRANNMWCETYVNQVSRKQFSSIWSDPDHQGGENNIAEMTVPRIQHKRQIPAEILSYLERNAVTNL